MHHHDNRLDVQIESTIVASQSLLWDLNIFEYLHDWQCDELLCSHQKPRVHYILLQCIIYYTEKFIFVDRNPL